LKKELFFTVPFQLRQGGLGIVDGRLLYFINDTFLGFSFAIIRLPTLLATAGIHKQLTSFVKNC
jgi:hypothetical protein